MHIAGYVDGKEIARVEWIREGKVPLQTIQAKIAYCSYVPQPSRRACWGMTVLKAISSWGPRVLNRREFS